MFFGCLAVMALFAAVGVAAVVIHIVRWIT